MEFAYPGLAAGGDRSTAIEEGLALLIMNVDRANGVADGHFMRTST